MLLASLKKIISPMFIALFSVLILSVSCTLSSQQAANQQNSPQNSSNEVNSKTTIQNETELERNRRIWLENNVKNYKITLESAIADALYTTLSPVEIEVREGKAISIRHLAKDEKSVSMEEAKNNYGLMLYERRRIDTVDGMFDLIKRAEEGKSGEGFKTILLEVKYDSKYGYPTKIRYDVAATDSFISLQVKKFEVVE